MKNKIMQGLFCLMLLPCGVNAMNHSVDVSNIRYSGTGCPKGSVSVNMAPNKGAVNAVFDRFFSAVGGKPGQVVKRCKLSMSLHLPHNKRVRLRQVRLRGFIDLPLNSYTKIVRNYRFDGVTKQLSNTWQGKLFKVINQREPFNASWSQCGKDVELEVESMLELKSHSSGVSQVGIDSFDQLMKRDYRGERGWKFILDYTPC